MGVLTIVVVSEQYVPKGHVCFFRTLLIGCAYGYMPMPAVQK